MERPEGESLLSFVVVEESVCPGSRSVRIPRKALLEIREMIYSPAMNPAYQHFCMVRRALCS